jgi:aerobic-type carbon monoxide dehydrogenase small subunit (CoxS/CutS family)
VLREWVGMTGTKYGCGIAQCGACTVLVDGVATRSCVTPLSLAAGKQITTIEGLASNGNLHPVQKAWLEHDVPQCGYCQSGMIMAVVEGDDVLKAAGDVLRYQNCAVIVLWYRFRSMSQYSRVRIM